MADYLYPQQAQKQEDIDLANYDYWNNWYRKLNPEAPVANTPTSAPGYGQAAQNTVDYTNMLKQGGQPSGNVDFSALSRNAGDTAKLNTGKADVTSMLNDLEENRKRTQGYEAGQFGREQQIGAMDQNMGRLPIDRFAQQLQLGDNVKAAWKQYEAQKQDPLSALLGGLPLVGSYVGGRAAEGKPII